MLNIIWLKLRLIFKSPIILFIYGIFSKWYIMVVMTSIIVVFWVFKGLLSAGILQSTEKIVWDALKDTKAIAQHCTPKIADPLALWECIGNPPQYKASKNEKELEKNVETLFDPKTYMDPYEEK